MKPIARVVFVVLIMSLLATALWWMNRPPSLPILPSLTATQISSASDNQIVHLVISDLRWKLQAAGPTSGAWRQWPESSRHVFALSWVEGDTGSTSSYVFRGFQDLRDNQDRGLPSFDEVIAAYEAIGASASAEIVRQARAVSQGIGDTSDHGTAFAALDRRFGQTLAAGSNTALRLAFIRANSEELAATR